MLTMLLRMVTRSLTRAWRKRLLSLIAVAAGTSLAVAMLNVSLQVGDRVNRELRSYGANIVVTPQAEEIPLDIPGADFDPLAGASYLSEEKLPQLKTIFWRNNIVAFAPYLEALAEAPGPAGAGRVRVVGTWFRQSLVIPTGETVVTGVRDTKPWWRVEGAWPDDAAGNSALAGRDVARKLSLAPGDTLKLVFPGEGHREGAIRVSGIVSAGGDEDGQVFVPLGWLQGITGLPEKVSRVEVSALTMPKNELGRKAETLGPDALGREEFDTWYCSPFVESVAYQIEEAIPGARARAVRQIAESEGAVLSKVQWLMALLALAAVVSSALSISSLMSASALERSREIALLKALGAYDSSVSWLFLAEAIAIGAAGGAAGLGVGLGLSGLIAGSVFGASLEIKALAVPAAFVVSVGVAVVGSLSAARTVSRVQPARVLSGG